jgi:hypothetical protein
VGRWWGGQGCEGRVHTSTGVSHLSFFHANGYVWGTHHTHLCVTQDEMGGHTHTHPCVNARTPHNPCVAHTQSRNSERRVSSDELTSWSGGPTPASDEGGDASIVGSNDRSSWWWCPPSWVSGMLSELSAKSSWHN